MDLIAGLDLGQSRDYSGLVVVERLAVEPLHGTGRLGEERHVRHIERFALAPYPVVVERVCELMTEPEMRAARLVLEATGVGRGIVDLFRDAHKDGYLPNWPVPVTITAGFVGRLSDVPTTVPMRSSGHEARDAPGCDRRLGCPRDRVRALARPGDG